MTSRYQIQMNFSQAERKAAELDGIASDLSRLSGTDLQNTLNSLGNNWKGENAGLYIGKGFQLIENMEKTAASLRQTAETIRSVARNIYNAEMEALRIAEERETTVHVVTTVDNISEIIATAGSSAEAHHAAGEISRAAKDMIRTAFSAMSSGEGKGGGFSTGGGNGGGGGGGGRF